MILRCILLQKQHKYFADHANLNYLSILTIELCNIRVSTTTKILNEICNKWKRSIEKMLTSEI